MKSIKNQQIVTVRQYQNAIKDLEILMSKGEDNLTEVEIESLGKMADLIETYENTHKMTPVPLSQKLKKENDASKIAAVLGYEPDLVEMIEFKMYQLKVNQNMLAGMLNMTTSKISQILNKKRAPDVTFLKGIHEKLDIDGNYLLEAV